MNERVEEIRQRHDCPDHPMRGGFREPCYVCELLAALAQVERERDQEKALRVKAIDRLDEVLTEVERLKNQVTALKVTWADSEADLARVRSALDREHICVMEACCNNAVRAALEGRG